MLWYFVVILGMIGFGLFKVFSMNSGGDDFLPLGFDDKPKPGMRVVQKIKEYFRKIIKEKVKIIILFFYFKNFRIRGIYSSLFASTFHSPLLNYFMVFGQTRSVSFLMRSTCSSIVLHSSSVSLLLSSPDGDLTTVTLTATFAPTLLLVSSTLFFWSSSRFSFFLKRSRFVSNLYIFYIKIYPCMCLIYSLFSHSQISATC